MTTDPHAALIDDLAKMLHRVDPIGGHSTVWKKLDETDRDWYRMKARALLPIVLREKAGAWDEGREGGLDDVDTSGYGGTAGRPNPYEKEATDGR